MKNVLNKVKGWRTVGFNGLAVVAPFAFDILGQILNLQEIQGIVPDRYLPYYLVFVGLSNIGLRAITNSSIGKK